MVGFETAGRGDRSTEALVLWRGDGESVSDLVTPRLSLLTLGVAGDVLLAGILVARGVSVEDLSNFNIINYNHNKKHKTYKFTTNYSYMSTPKTFSSKLVHINDKVSNFITSNHN